MRVEHDMTPIVRAWLKDTKRSPYGARQTVASVMERVPDIGQRPRYRWFTPSIRRLSPEVRTSDTDGPTPARGFTMFSALKFVAASVIVALFGSFLLAGILTTQQGDEMAPAGVTTSPDAEATSEATESPDPSARTDILPGVDLTVEEVEPGVYRVVDDGVRDLASKNDDDIVAGPDGGIWLLRHQRYFRLGSDELHKWATKQPDVSDFAVASDGTVWTVQEGAIQSFDGQEWTTHQAAGWGANVEVTPDGTVWAFWHDPEQEFGQLFGYLDEDRWQALGDFSEAKQLLIASRDDIWAIGSVDDFSRYLYRFVDGAWQRLVGIEGTEATWQQAEDPLAKDADFFGDVAVGPDGTFWGVAFLDSGGPPGLVRFDGSGWRWWPLFDTESGRRVSEALLPVSVGSLPPGSSEAFEVAPDGSVWFSTSCDGVGHFDGVTWDQHLPGLCVEAIDITADGAVWLLAGEKAGRSVPLDLYVITPEAVAGTE